MTAGPEPDEVDLVRKAQAGDTAAFGRLVERYQNAVLGFVYGATGRADAVEDLAQETFLKAFEALDRLQDARSFPAWLRVIAQHTATDWVRAQRPEVSVEALREAGTEPAAPPAEIGKGLGVAEAHGRVLAAMAGLREDYREILILKHIEDRSYKEIAEFLDMSVSAVGEKLSRVRGILKRKLKELTEP